MCACFYCGGSGCCCTSLTARTTHDLSNNNTLDAHCLEESFYTPFYKQLRAALALPHSGTVLVQSELRTSSALVFYLPESPYIDAGGE